MFVCKSPGMANDRIFTQYNSDLKKWEARQAFALFGSFQMKEEDLEKIDFNPFHPDFHDNCHKGHGDTEAEAIENMHKSAEQTYESLWD